MREELDREEILASLSELAGELGVGNSQHVVIVAGGSLMALHGLRDTTRDVDSLARMDDELCQAADRVALRRDLEPGTWLNASAVAWRPLTLREADCTIVLDHPRLLVLAAPLREVFLMKLLSTRARDSDDLPALWPHAGFSSAAEAIACLYDQAYPWADRDPYLQVYLEGVIRRLQGDA